MSNKNIFGPGGSITIKLLLRRTLVLLVILFGTCITVSPLFGQTATWIWYPGDFEISLSNQMQNRRTERSTFYPVFWKMDNHFDLVEFSNAFNISQSEEISI